LQKFVNTRGHFPELPLFRGRRYNIITFKHHNRFKYFTHHLGTSSIGEEAFGVNSVPLRLVSVDISNK